MKQKNTCNRKLDETIQSLGNERDPVKLFRTQYNTKHSEKKEAVQFELSTDKNTDIAWFKDIMYAFSLSFFCLLSLLSR